MRVERELEASQRERCVDACGRANSSSGVLPEQQHLQAAVFLQFEPIIGRCGLADGETDLLTAVYTRATRLDP